MAINATKDVKREKPKKATPKEQMMLKRLNDGFTGKIKMKLKKGKK